MSVHKRPNGRWVAQVYEAQTRRMRQVGTYATRREAQRAEQDAHERRAAGGRETVGSFAGRWMRDFPRPADSTNRHNDERVRRFADQYSDRRLDSLAVEEAYAWARDRPGDVPALRAMFGDARRHGKVIGNPFSGLGMHRQARRDIAADWLTEADLDVLTASARLAHGPEFGPVMAAMITFAAWTGVRTGELFALRPEDLVGDTLLVRRSADSRTRTVKPHTKNRLQRTVVLPEAAREAASSAPRLQGQEWLFVGPRGRQLWASAFSWLWKPVKVAAGRPTMDFYELRHFCATRLLELGLSPTDVAVQLGHRDGGRLVMRVYGHPSEVAARARILAAVDGLEHGDVAEMRRRRAG